MLLWCQHHGHGSSFELGVLLDIGIFFGLLCNVSEQFPAPIRKRNLATPEYDGYLDFVLIFDEPVDMVQFYLDYANGGGWRKQMQHHRLVMEGTVKLMQDNGLAGTKETEQAIRDSFKHLEGEVNSLMIFNAQLMKENADHRETVVQ